jgi:hypothetical protein
MARFLRTIVRDFTTLSSTGEISLEDLPVNPVSALILTLRGEQPAAQVTNAFDWLNDFLAAVDNVRIIRSGENLIQGNLPDLMMVNAALTGYVPHGTHASGAAALRSMSFLLSLSRRPYWPEEALPAQRRGVYSFGMNVLDTSPGTLTTLEWALEAIELPEATPTRYLKYTTRTHAISTTGRRRLTMPIGNRIMGVLLFDPESEITTTELFFWDKVKVLKDNVEQYYAESNWESLRADLGMRIHGVNTRFGHAHGHAAADTSVGQELHLENRAPLQYGYLDFDPLMDGSYALETVGASDVELDASSTTNTGTARFLPVELVETGGTAAAA